MSGIEVLGLVLGAIPLLISAFEHMRDACEARDLLVHFKAKHSKCWNDVKDEELVFRLHLRKLLLPLATVDVLANDEIDALVLEALPSTRQDGDFLAATSKWKDHDLDAALHRRLGDAYDRYFSNLEKIPKLLHKLLMMLGYQLSPFQQKMQSLQAAQATSPGYRARVLLEANARFLRQQLEFAVKKASREQLMDELHERIQKLETFLAISDEVTTLQEQNTVVVPRKAIVTLLQYGQQANCLYSLIYNCWHCSCKHSHYAHLWLQHQVGPRFEFRMLLLYAPKGSQAQPLPPWQQQGLQILQNDVQRALDLQAQPGSQDSVRPSAVAMTADRVPSLWPTKRRRVKKVNVRFDVPTSSPPKARPVTPQHPCGDGRLVSKKARLGEATILTLQSEIGDLCQTLANCGMMAGCVGSLTDPSLGRSYQVLTQPRQKIIADEISLHDVLQPEYRPRLSRVSRFDIALKVASSHLKLVSTKWARTQWESRDIRFPYGGGEQKGIMSDEPYISANFRDTDTETGRTPSKTDRSFACLGIMLLELLFGRTLEQHDLWLQLGPDKVVNSTFRLMVARAWADDAEGETGKPFASVIMWCLNESPATLEGEQWRKDFAEKVVLPLEKCCEWTQTTPP